LLVIVRCEHKLIHIFYDYIFEVSEKNLHTETFRMNV